MQAPSRIIRSCGVVAPCFAALLFGMSFGVLPRSLAETQSQATVNRPWPAMSPRDPVEFLSQLPNSHAYLPSNTRRYNLVADTIAGSSYTLSASEVSRAALAVCEEAEALGMDPLLVVALMRIESNYNHLAVSPVGAEGLMQVMPETAAWTAEHYGLEWPDGNSFDPILNVRIGVRYLGELERHFDRPEHILTAYNRGPRATRYILTVHGELPREVEDFYASKVLASYQHLLAVFDG